MTTGPDTRSVAGTMSLFGHDSTDAVVELADRSRRWRTLRAVRVLVATALLAPLVALVPPHAPWAIGAVVGGLYLARRRFRERTTLVEAEGPCPRCGETVHVQGPVALRTPHPAPCEACHHEVTLRLDGEADRPG